MDAITCLLSRNSSVKLTGPAPQGEQRDKLFQAALRAPDHARLRPWRFLSIEGEARQALGELYVRAALAENPQAGNDQLDKLRNNVMRAPLMVVVVARIVAHPKVPREEQLLSAGAAAQNILLAAHAQGYAAMWRTGPMAYNATVKQGLGLSEGEEIVGYLYIGTPQSEPKPAPQLNIGDYVVAWQG